MFIEIIYRDSPELSTNTLSSNDLSEEKSLMVNPKCPVRILLEYIRSRCSLGLYTRFDLCDASGAVMGLFDMPTHVYATDYFVNGGTYYVIVIRQEKNKSQIFPQLNHSNPLYAKLKERVRSFLEGGAQSATSITRAKSHT